MTNVESLQRAVKNLTDFNPNRGEIEGHVFAGEELVMGPTGDQYFFGHFKVPVTQEIPGFGAIERSAHVNIIRRNPTQKDTDFHNYHSLEQHYITADGRVVRVTYDLSNGGELGEVRELDETEIGQLRLELPDWEFAG